jgi:hypothetical protein
MTSKATPSATNFPTKTAISNPKQTLLICGNQMSPLTALNSSADMHSEGATLENAGIREQKLLPLFNRLEAFT